MYKKSDFTEKTGLRYGGNGQPKGIGPLKKGEPRKFGYHNLGELTQKERRNSLIKAEKSLGAATLVRKLGAIRTYLKKTSPHTSKIFHLHQKWVRKHFDEKFKGDYKSNLYMEN